MKRTLRDAANTIPTALIAAHFPPLYADHDPFHLCKLQMDLITAIYEEHEVYLEIDLFNSPLESIPEIELGSRSQEALSDFQNALVPYVHASMERFIRSALSRI